MTNPISATSPLGAAAAAAPTQTTSGAIDKLDLDSDAFLKLLVAQLKYQNPANPMDPTSMMAQTAQLAVVDRIDQLLKAQESAAHTNQISLAASLIGRTVDFVGPTGAAASGTVTSVNVSDANVHVMVGGIKVDVVDIVRVTDTSTATPSA